ncbi:acetoin:2,6-dichlorophenolindophenol oxidoreductase subunit alpha [Catellatospora sp. TT07R-123]|uniref:thiamine pyrophosphate-dependent dehydrogenase E1 component subunit alpha n=1 Tax=Catellatospora sp. TT07R-123 TaxID=2733863 RepID=UPI001B115DD9|nr:thiamine pyrophosphate-dependent dehydrogenase E1 component subunit alpha [Catellatospora sp. TT07R-123]GHJ47735.1 acetoin:2,6-dichlorophenolindophenol oxidoreductase subunit alpha [Catellatospora sp. TT07R-123]
MGVLRERLYRTVRLIRRFEEQAIELVRAGVVVGGIHPCIGQEAVAAGVCATLSEDDVVLSNHRNHGHALAKGCRPDRVMAELAGRVTGTAGGRAGSLHVSDYAAGLYGATITVGHGAAIATGVAWAAAREGSGRVVVSFVGDGAMNQGALLESLNLAALWQVPHVFVCENNGYATTQAVGTFMAGSVTGRAAAFGIPAETVDGMDPEAVHEAAARAVDRARSGGGPTLLELVTYRFDAHHTFEHRVRLRYRAEEEVARWRERDPVALQGSRIPPDVRDRIDREVEDVLAEAVRFAQDSPRPDPADALDHLYATGMRPRAGVVG